MKKKLFAVISLFTTATCSFALSACAGKTPEPPAHTHTYSAEWSHDETHHWHAATCEHTDEMSGKAAHEFENGVCTVCEYEKITYEKLLSDYKAQAVAFFETKLRPSVVGETAEADIKAESWFIEDSNDDDKIDKATVVWTYATEGAMRNVEIAELTPTAPVAAADIANGIAGNVESTVDRRIYFEFDAKSNYNHKELASALFDSVNADLTPDYVLFQEKEIDGNLREFSLYVNTDSVYQKYDITVRKGDGSEQAVINNLKSPDDYVSKRRSNLTVTGDNIKSVEYALENLGPDETDVPGTPDNPDKPDNPDTPDVPDVPAVTNAELIQALNENCLSRVLEETAPGSNISVNNIISSQWYVNKDSNDNITDAVIMYNYRRNTQTEEVIVSKVEFASPIKAADLIEGKNTNANYTRVFRSSAFDPTIQESRTDLTNVICNKLFGEKTNKVNRYIIYDGTTSGAQLEGTVGIFKVIEINDNNIKESSILIKYAQNDSEYISNMNDTTKYFVEDEKSYDITGTKLENTQTVETKAGNVSINFDDDYELC